MRVLSYIPLISVFLLLCACSEEVRYAHTLEEAKFEKKINAPLTLERGQRRLDYVAGKPGQRIMFLLKNTGLEAVKIDEWYMNEQENIRLYYAVCEKGKSGELKDADFRCVWPTAKAKKKDPGRHMPVCLNPNNAIVLEAPMEFLKKFSMRDKPIVTIAVKAELNLKTVEAKSPVYEIDIRPIVIQM